MYGIKILILAAVLFGVSVVFSPLVALAAAGWLLALYAVWFARQSAGRKPNRGSRPAKAASANRDRRSISPLGNAGSADYRAPWEWDLEGSPRNHAPTAGHRRGMRQRAAGYKGFGPERMGNPARTKGFLKPWGW